MKSLRFTCFFIKQTKEVEQVEKFVRSLSITIPAKYEDEIYKLYPRRLERYLSIAWDSGAVPVIVLTKVDLCDDLEEKRLEIENVAVGVPVVETSGLTGDGLQQIEQYLQGTKTVAFIGSSGVGKSTLINKLMSEECLKTNTRMIKEDTQLLIENCSCFQIREWLLIHRGCVNSECGMQEKESNILFLILRNWQKNVASIIAHRHLNQNVQYELQ